jgi:hypothetical protein
MLDTAEKVIPTAPSAAMSRITATIGLRLRADKNFTAAKPFSMWVLSGGEVDYFKI